MKHPSCNSTRRITLLTIIIATRTHWANGSRTASSGSSAGKSIAEEQESTTRWQKRIKFQLCCCEWLLLPGSCRLKLQSEEAICVSLVRRRGQLATGCCSLWWSWSMFCARQRATGWSTGVDRNQLLGLQDVVRSVQRWKGIKSPPPGQPVSIWTIVEDFDKG